MPRHRLQHRGTAGRFARIADACIKREHLEGIAMAAMTGRRVGRQPAFTKVGIAADVAVGRTGAVAADRPFLQPSRVGRHAPHHRMDQRLRCGRVGILDQQRELCGAVGQRPPDERGRHALAIRCEPLRQPSAIGERRTHQLDRRDRGAERAARNRKLLGTGAHVGERLAEPGGDMFEHQPCSCGQSPGRSTGTRLAANQRLRSPIVSASW